MTQGLSGELKQKMLDNIPLKRMGKPEDIAAIKAGTKALYVFGEIHYIDVFGKPRCMFYRWVQAKPNFNGLRAADEGNYADRDCKP